MTHASSGTLKLVSAYSKNYGVRDRVEAALKTYLRPDQFRYLHGRVYLLATSATPAEIQSWLQPALDDGDSLFVVEFADWTSVGPTADRAWLAAQCQG